MVAIASIFYYPWGTWVKSKTKSMHLEHILWFSSWLPKHAYDESYIYAGSEIFDGMCEDPHSLPYNKYKDNYGWHASCKWNPVSGVAKTKCNKIQTGHLAFNQALGTELALAW